MDKKPPVDAYWAQWQIDATPTSTIITRNCGEANDVTSMLSIVGASLPTLLRPEIPAVSRARGRELLEGVEQFIRRNGLMYKLFLPERPDNEVEREIERAVLVCNEASSNFAQLPEQMQRRFSRIGTLIKAARSIQEDDLTSEQLRIIMVTITSEEATKHPRFKEMVEVHMKIAQIANRDRKGKVEVEDIERLRDHETVIGGLLAASRTRAMPECDYFTVRRNGMSLDAIIHPRSAGDFNDRVVRYLQGVSPGDYLVQRIVEGLFFKTTRFNMPLPSDFFNDPELAESIAGFQQYLAEAVVLPALLPDESEARKRTDVQIAKIFNALDIANCAKLGILLFRVLTKGADWYRVYHPEATEQEALAKSPLHSRMHAMAPDRLIRTDRVLVELLKNHAATVRERIQGRFPGNEKIKSFLDAFSRISTFDYYEGILEAQFSEHLKAVFPENAEEKGKGVVIDPKNMIVQGRYAGAAFSPHSFAAEVQGAVDIMFEKSEIEGLKYRFMMNFSNPFVRIDGGINQNGAIIDVPTERMRDAIQSTIEEALAVIEPAWEAHVPEVKSSPDAIRDAHSSLDKFLRGEEK